MFTSAPVLTTARLTLSPHRVEDFPDLVSMWSDMDVTRHIGGRPFTEEEVWTRLLRAAGLWSLLGYGYWLVRETETNAFVGEIGFADFHRELEPRIDGAPEMGWVLSPAVHGKGYATEAVTAALAWLDTTLQAPRAVCLIAPDNAASFNVAAKAGFKAFARSDYKGLPTVLLERFSDRL